MRTSHPFKKFPKQLGTKSFLDSQFVTSVTSTGGLSRIVINKLRKISWTVHSLFITILAPSCTVIPRFQILVTTRLLIACSLRRVISVNPEMPRNLAFFLITIATFLPGLPTLRANKISNGKESMSVRLLEMRQNITDQQLEFLVQKIALLEV